MSRRRPRPSERVVYHSIDSDDGEVVVISSEEEAVIKSLSLSLSLSLSSLSLISQERVRVSTELSKLLCKNKYTPQPICIRKLFVSFCRFRVSRKIRAVRRRVMCKEDAM